MRISYQSDLHLEFFRNQIAYQLSNNADIIILAGDIGLTKPQYFRWVLEQTNGIPTVMVLGNHENYGTSVQRAVRKWEDAMSGSHVHILNNASSIINGVRFIGSTLWTDYSLFGAGNRQLAMRTAEMKMNDFKKIRFERGATYRRFTSGDAYFLHSTAKMFLKNELAVSYDGPTIVVTHHAPCLESVTLNCRNELLMSAYASDLTDLILQYQPTAWIHGHLHNSTNINVGGTKILANPRGYLNEINPEFDPEAALIL